MAALLRNVPRLPGMKVRWQHLMFPDSCLASSTSAGIHLSYSSWEYELPWSSAMEEQGAKKLLQRVQESRKEYQQKVDLNDALMVLVKDYLTSNHKEAFALQSASQFWTRDDQEDASDSNKDIKTTAAKVQTADTTPAIAINDTLFELVNLNGFKPVDLPQETVPLAEGVVVRPQYHKEETYRSRVRQKKAPRMWARSEPKKGQSALPTSSSVMSSAQPRKDDLPELVEEDIKLYRIIENSLDDFLQAKYQAFRTSVAKVEAKIDDTVGAWVPSLRRQDDAEKKRKQAELEDEMNSEASECLLFLDRNEIIWVTNMDKPKLRLLALSDHHNYGLKVSSWLISISLVVFGAVPLAYRSYNFTYEYPGLSQTLAASVVVTIAYGIWSTQSMAVTRQSRVVSNAIAHRIYARNNAVLWALQWGAVERVTDALLMYYFHCQNDTRQRLRLRPSSSSKPLLAVTKGSGQKESEKLQLPSTSIDVIALARDIGLVQEEGTADSKDAMSGSGGRKRVAVPIENAIIAVQEYHKKMKR